MANLELKGTLIEKGETVQKSETFKVREFFIDVAGEKFSDFYKVQLANDKCSLIDSAKVGDTLDMKLNVRGRKWYRDGKMSYFTTLEAWFVKVEANNQPGAPTQQINSTDPEKGDGENELPF